ncbi:ABC transporter substrate-binding protein [Priestia taiwanensis]|uniref:Ferrichrome ABC transporter substrate-binding protein n=1 Tax=Priestia taiwanensis TaxID=1347902 RepID=A0A917ARW6_9BACI|nr:ABC transporter substrate-binding protein [Priestia taiwanensis]MBM7363169.1 iron complex transport system substrate-binding protein [Priestia taiwanensis]GGE68254.1 ferrichrome ABC transporter substrate-binding protein [Priestia taiwanensis]
MNKKRSLLLMLVVALMSLFAVACTSDKEDAKAADTKTVKHAKGEVEIPVEPKRIVDLSGSTEELILLDKKPITTANTYKEKIQKHLVGDLEGVDPLGWYWGDKVDIEKVMEYKPDMIIINNRQVKLYDQLAKITPATVVLESELDDWRGKFKEVARLFDKEATADAWLKDYDAKAAELSTKVKEQTKDEKFMFLAVAAKNYRVYGNFGYGDILFNDLKLPNIERKDVDKPYDQISLEGLHAFNPDHLVTVNFGGDADKLNEEMKKSVIWNNINAVKNNNVYEIDNETFNSKGFNPIGKMSALEDIEKMLLKK